MSAHTRRLSLCIDADLLRRFDYAAQQSGRSMNRMMRHLIRQFVERFEKENGCTLPPDEA